MQYFRFEALKKDMDSKIKQQVERFKSGFPFIHLSRPATINDGILKISDPEKMELIQFYDEKRDALRIVKFVPASGAATRMFKDLFAGIEQLEAGNPLNANATIFLENISEFTFFEMLKDELAGQVSFSNLLNDSSAQIRVLKKVLQFPGLGFGSLPKGAIPFHFYNGAAETPLLDHIIEGMSYAKTNDGVAIHFTVSAEHQSLFEELANKYSSDLSTMNLSISFSNQLESTNTVAVSPSNEPVAVDGELLMRPGGHGALLENLNQLDADMVFIKNIDNVVRPALEPENSTYKKLIAGVLLQKQALIAKLLLEVDRGQNKRAIQFCKNELGLELRTGDELKQALNRPIRVCGMVENTGEPGGGPFWVRGKDGKDSLQIVEKAQINLMDSHQAKILGESTHFNPVDLACWIKNYKDEKFDLLLYRDDDTGFITEKSFQGKTIKAMELPGLWNGAMAGWITYFIEVPLETFNPVKTVIDLLKPSHKD